LRSLDWAWKLHLDPRSREFANDDGIDSDHRANRQTSKTERDDQLKTGSLFKRALFVGTACAVAPVSPPNIFASA
jgi:hypothetical protein